VLFVVLLSCLWIFSILAKRSAGKSFAKMTYLVSGGILNLNSVSQFVTVVILCMLRRSV